MRIGDYETHPAADAFPLLEGDDFDELLEDVAENGQREPILVIRRRSGDVVVDGRNRLRACVQLGLKPSTVTYSGKRDMEAIVRLVKSCNLHRRHMHAAMRALVAVDLSALVQQDAAKRRQASQNNDAGRAVRANLRAQERGKTSEILAREFDVSARSVDHAKVVADRGVPELRAAIKNDGVAISTAEQIARLDADTQRELLERAEGSPRSLRRLLKERRAAEPAASESPSTSTAPPSPFVTGVEELKDHLRRARGACAALVQATPWPEEWSLEARTAETGSLIAALDGVIAKADRLGRAPDLRLVHGGAGEIE